MSDKRKLSDFELIVLLHKRTADLSRKLDIAVKALEWYANEKNYEGRLREDVDVMNDGGALARQSLRSIEDYEG